METIKLRDEFIKLGQVLKAAGWVEDGVEAKFAVQDGKVSVNGETDTRRGRKLYDGHGNHYVYQITGTEKLPELRKFIDEF